MIAIEPLASSSAGNAYKVSDGTTTLLLEAGIRFSDLRKALHFQVSQIAGCLVTHEHQDHCKAVADLLKAGVDVYASYGTFDALKLDGHHRAHPIAAKQPFSLGTWYIVPFDVEHDVAEPLGFLLQATTGERLAFLTDTYYCRYRFEGLTHIMLEANYSLQILDRNIADGRVPHSMRKRLLRSHMSLETAKQFLISNDLSKVQEIHLMHLSDSNSDEAFFKREIQQIAGCPVYVARR